MCLVNLVMSSDGLQEDGFGSLVLDKSKDDPDVVGCATGPRAFQFAFQLMRFQAGMKGVGRQEFQGRLDTGGALPLLSHQLLSCCSEST